MSAGRLTVRGAIKLYEIGALSREKLIEDLSQRRYSSYDPGSDACEKFADITDALKAGAISEEVYYAIIDRRDDLRPESD